MISEMTLFCFVKDARIEFSGFKKNRLSKSCILPDGVSSIYPLLNRSILKYLWIQHILIGLWLCARHDAKWGLQKGGCTYKAVHFWWLQAWPLQGSPWIRIFISCVVLNVMWSLYISVSSSWLIVRIEPVNVLQVLRRGLGTPYAFVIIIHWSILNTFPKIPL